MHAEDIEYTYEGQRLVGHLVVDDSHDGKRPGVLVAHEATGLTDHAKNSARRLAELGYVAFALDYFGDGKPLPPEEIGKRFGELSADVMQMRGLARAGLDVLLADPRTDASKVAAIGYCFGGSMMLELARSGADLAAVVGFHSALGTSRPEDAANIKGSVLVLIGADDPIIPPEQRLAFEKEMRDAGVDWRMYLYGNSVHSFTNPTADGSMPGVLYNALTDARSWRAMLDLFEEKFGSK